MTSYDYATCFDSLWLEECLLSLIDLGVSSTTVQLLYELNKKATITVKTPFGDAAPFTTENIVKQGTVWGSKLCCASTAQICDEDVVGGASIGNCTIHSTVYVDDCNRFNTDVIDTDLAHDNFVNFSNRKRSPLNAEKCVNLTINKQTHINPPTLMIGDHVLEEVTSTKVVGDNFNQKGNNTTLIEHRVKLGKGVTNSILAMCNETTYGSHRIEVLLLLYKTVFIQTIIFNSQAWSHITEDDLKALRTVQLRCLKRILWTAQSTPNSHVFLELGVLPIEYEIQIKQCTHLYHILSLPSDHPIRHIYNEQLRYPDENNWANNMNRMRDTYSFPEDDAILEMSRDSWKEHVEEVVMQEGRKSLLKKCQSLSKTSSLEYKDGCTATQEYLLTYPFHTASLIFKIRGRSTNCLANRGRKEQCRLCKSGIETQNHAVNCPSVVCEKPPLQIAELYGNVQPNDENVIEIVERYTLFENALKRIDSESA